MDCLTLFWKGVQKGLAYISKRAWAVQIHYVILALPSSLFLMEQQKNHQKMYRKRKGKQTFFVNKQD
jgi:hypothetical protein